MNDSDARDEPQSSREQGPFAWERLPEPRLTLAARLNARIVPATVLVALFSVVWIGVHLWPDLDAARWQGWADSNAGFFEPLEPGSVVAIVPDLHSHSGLLVTRTAGGVVIRMHLWFPFGETPLGLVVSPEAADRWLELRYTDSDFWARWHALAADPGIHLYEHLRPDETAARGYAEFVRRLRQTTD